MPHQWYAFVLKSNLNDIIIIARVLYKGKRVRDDYICTSKTQQKVFPNVKTKTLHFDQCHAGQKNKLSQKANELLEIKTALWRHTMDVSDLAAQEVYFNSWRRSRTV